MWRRVALELGCKCGSRRARRMCTAAATTTTTRRHSNIEDEGDWSYSSEWWGTESDGYTILRSNSCKGNGVVSVIAHPSSRPSLAYWSEAENWLQQRYADVYPRGDPHERFRVLGYQWRVLRFNDDTRQSTVKIMAAYRQSEPESLYLMQQAHCLAVPYLKSMVSVGLSTIVSCNYDLMNAVRGKKTMNILCVGHGGGSLPLFLATKIQGACVDIVEIDPLVISASTQAMGFPSFSVLTPLGDHAISRPDVIDEVFWRGVHERLYLFEADAENFILETNKTYDMVFVDAYDGDDVFPRKLWDPDSPFPKALSEKLHPQHGTVVVNLHSDSDLVNYDGSVASVLQQFLPMGQHVSKVCQAYKDVLVGNSKSGFGFIVSVPWVCNSSLLVCRGSGVGHNLLNRDTLLDTIVSKSLEVEYVLDLPFSCLQYIKRDFRII